MAVIRISQNRIVEWLAVSAGEDHLLRYARRPAVDALTELIWNGLDADADRVDVTVQLESLGGDDPRMFQVSGIEVVDNGHGITPSIARRAFPSLGDSWKKTLNGRTVGKKRILHGRQGLGRFIAYSLGHRLRWESVSQSDRGGFQRLDIEGTTAHINGYSIGDPALADGPAGTRVRVDVEQERHLTPLMDEDLPIALAARLAAHLLANPDIQVWVDGNAIDTAPLVDRDPIDIPLDGLDPDVIGSYGTPVLTVVEWTPEMRQPLGLVLCNEGGASLQVVMPKPAPGPLKATGYLRWAGFEQSDLVLPDMEFPEILDEARARLGEYVQGRTAELTATIVTELKNEGSYPYPDESAGSPLEQLERDMFDVIVVTARKALGQTKAQRSMSSRLLQLALQERPAELDQILEAALGLDAEQRQELADMLRYSNLGSIVGAAAEVSRRTELLLSLRHLLYDAEEAKRLREVDQLHPLIRDNTWIFGEEWRLAASEVGLTTVLKEVLKDDDIALEAELIDRETGHRELPEKLRGRVDLLLERTIQESAGPVRLVVELKRPSKVIGEAELTQVRRYASRLSGHPGGGDARWVFWLVGSVTSSDIEAELNQDGRVHGHVSKTAKYDIHVTTWGDLINLAERRLDFYLQQLGYDITQEEAVKRVRTRHAALLSGSGRGRRSGQSKGETTNEVDQASV